ncbi:MAG: HAD-IIIA family hydrolase, partial [Candidatus Omnitrophica bacterium]|nr:HAD-IIIA family hydrolase [Candidatus Omnitrophota bacterium]
MNDDLEMRLGRVKLLALDLDGVLTDGGLWYGNHGDEIKRFDIHDGFGVVLLGRGGIPTVIVSGKKSRVNERRAKELGVAGLYQNVTRKDVVVEKILKRLKLSWENVCFVGDDVIDLPVMKRAGVAVAVSDAVGEVLKAAHYVTHNRGGHGAVREVT